MADDDVEDIELVTSRGNSESWRKGKANHARIWNIFVETWQSDNFPRLLSSGKWSPGAVSKLTDRKTWHKFATFISKQYKSTTGKNAGDYLAVDVAVNTMNGLLQTACDQFRETGSEATKLLSSSASPAALPGQMAQRTPEQRRSGVSAAGSGDWHFKGLFGDANLLPSRHRRRWGVRPARLGRSREPEVQYRGSTAVRRAEHGAEVDASQQHVMESVLYVR